MSPSLSFGSDSGTIDDSINSKDNGDNEHSNTTTTCKHLQGNCGHKEADMTCTKNYTAGILRTSLDTPIPKKREQPNTENDCREKPVNVNCSEPTVDESNERTNASVCSRRSSSSSSGGGDNVASRTEFINDTTNKKNKYSLRGVTDERARNLSSSTLTEQALRARRMSVANSLSISNSTLTNVNIIIHFPFVINY